MEVLHGVLIVASIVALGVGGWLYQRRYKLKTSKSSVVTGSFEDPGRITKIVVSDVTELKKIMRGLLNDGIYGVIQGEYQPFRERETRLTDKGEVHTIPAQEEEITLWIEVSQKDLHRRVQEITEQQFIEDLRK